MKNGRWFIAFTAICTLAALTVGGCETRQKAVMGDSGGAAAQPMPKKKAVGGEAEKPPAPSQDISKD